MAALPRGERKQFEHLFLAIKSGSQSPSLADRPNWPDFGERLRDIFGDKTASDSQSIIDEGRSLPPSGSEGASLSNNNRLPLQSRFP